MSRGDRSQPPRIVSELAFVLLVVCAAGFIAFAWSSAEPSPAEPPCPCNSPEVP